MKKYFIGSTLLVPLWAHAADLEYTLISGGIPGLSGNGVFKSGDLSELFNALFNLAVLVGSIIAVILIAAAGIEYMTSDAAGKKGDAKNRIRNALVGLLLLLATYIIFEQINPSINDMELDLPSVHSGAQP